MLNFDVTVEKRSKKRLSPEKVKAQLRAIGESAKRNRVSGWGVTISGKLMTETEVGTGENREIQYTAVIRLSRERYLDEGSVRRRFEKTKLIMARAARKQKWKLIGEEALVPINGVYHSVNGAGEPTGDPAPSLILPKRQQQVSPYLGGEELPKLTDEVMMKYFGRIYDRDSHIRLIYDNLVTAVKTRFKVRHHILLKGPPSCAKTELFLAFVDWWGDDLIEEIDASTMTKAGLERLLLDKAQNGMLKPILLLEEVEKCHPDNISCLIQVMDARGKIQRVNAHTVRDDDTSANCPIVLWGTCNDESELEKVHKGAIWSRFSNKMDCERPDRGLMEKILLREIKEISGDPAWVTPVLDFCFNELQALPRFSKEFDDPRFARSLLVGRERILDTSEAGFFADQRKVKRIKRYEQPRDSVYASK